MSILSIQSHVAYGHVGNAAAAFALQRLGLEVWPVMTVQLSNHTGYAGWRGRSFEAEHIAELVARPGRSRRPGQLPGGLVGLPPNGGGRRRGAELPSTAPRRCSPEAIFRLRSRHGRPRPRPLRARGGRGLFQGPRRPPRPHRDAEPVRAGAASPGGPSSRAEAALAAAQDLAGLSGRRWCWSPPCASPKARRRARRRASPSWR